MSWTGGNCPGCGEFMPAGVIRCRYCHGALNDLSDGGAGTPVSVTPAAETPVDALAGSGERTSIPEVAVARTAPVAAPSSVALKSPEKKGRRRKAAGRPLTPTLSPEGGGEGTKEIPARHQDRFDSATAALAPWNEGAWSDGTWQYAVWVIAALLLAPLCVSGPVPGAATPLSYFGLPMVHSGDEPHYLVLINSVISDGDIDVANNYADVHAGGPQAGRKFAGWALDHHVNWYWHEHLIHWWQAYENDYTRWEKDANGHPVPTLRADSIHRPVSPREYSQHTPGLAWLVAPFVWPFRGTGLVEPMVLLCSSLATVVGLLAFCRLVRPYSSSLSQVVLVALVAYLGSPLWHYGRTIYVEPFLALFSVVAYAAALRSNRYLVAGMFVAAGVLLKVPFAVIAVPLIGDALLRKQWKQAISCGAPILVAGALLLLCNYRTHGGWLLFPQKWEWGLPLVGVAGLAFSWQHGLILFSPVVLVSLFAVPEWFRRQRREATLIATATVLYVLVMASWAQWWGGTCYSARLIVPVVPFLFAPLCSLLDSPRWKSDARLRIATWSLAAVSVGFGMVGAFSCEHVWDKHPLQIVFAR